MIKQKADIESKNKYFLIKSNLCNIVSYIEYNDINEIEVLSKILDGIKANYFIQLMPNFFNKDLIVGELRFSKSNDMNVKILEINNELAKIEVIRNDKVFNNIVNIKEDLQLIIYKSF